ncbi:unnamed protein product [Brachionus calyciflorus]|uniref:Dynein light intermediate chain n=1 Tax=Brachionus calyciflorus TaxID=104777 RepID=A0A813QSN0_9BILA|nr:unnamed protein product [Brachionus calyciflorus]
MTVNDNVSLSSQVTEDINQFSNIWSQILQDVQNSTKKTPPPKSLIILGDNESGRSTLIARLKGVESISKGIGLEYHYIDIKDEDRDDVPKLGVWIPDGDASSTNLLKYALNESNFENSMVAFVVSMSNPWDIMDSLKKWSKILTDHIKKLNIPEAKRNEYLRKQRQAFQMYQDPDENVNVLNNKKTNLNSSMSKNDKKDLNESIDNDDSLLLPLDPSVLNSNLGIPIIVIVTKSDYISILDKDMEYRIEHFDFIQYHIRKFCLDYGAALFYTTVKEKKTFDRLYRYLIHKLYSYPFNSASSVVDRELIFIPSGWDNEGKINILLENSTTIKSDSDFSEIISKPTIRKSLPREVETIIASEDQEFLAKLQILLSKSTTPSVKSEEISPSVQMPPQVFKTPQKPPLLKGPSTTGTDRDSTNLKNFFQNLLNKNAPSSAPLTSSAPTLPTSSSASNLANIEQTPTGIPNSPPQVNVSPLPNQSSESNA